MKGRVVEATAPTRVDLAGGTLDIWPIGILVPDAVTVNLAIDVRARAVVEPRDDGRIVVVSHDLGRRARRALPLGPRSITGPLAYLLRIASCFSLPRGGVTITTRAEAPAGSGLGGSSALGIAVGGALDRFTSAKIERSALLRRIMNVETREIRVPTGDQDYRAALHGGLAAYHHTVDGTVREALAIPEGLGERLVMAYAGGTRRSGYSNWDMYRRFVDGERSTVRRMEKIASIAIRLRRALAEGDVSAAGRLLGEEGRLRYRLAPTVATPGLLSAGAAARRAGAHGVKVCGAGGGGCVVAIARAGRAGAVRDALVRAGAIVLDARPARTGLRVSER